MRVAGWGRFGATRHSPLATRPFTASSSGAVKLTRTHRPATHGGPFSGSWVAAPLVNVVLLLLFFFLLGSSLVQQPGVALDLPPAPTGGAAGLTVPSVPDALVVSIQRDNPPRIYFQDRPVSAEELAGRLAAAGGVGRPVVLRADRGTPYETVMAVSARALAAGHPVVLASAPEVAGRTP